MGYSVTGEIDPIVSALTDAMTGRLVRPILVPLDSISEVWTDSIKPRLVRTGEYPVSAHAITGKSARGPSLDAFVAACHD
jgi:hypothetical protein